MIEKKKDSVEKKSFPLPSMGMQKRGRIKTRENIADHCKL